VEERRATRFDRLIRLAGRGREASAPAATGLVVIVPIVLLVSLVTVITLVVWLALR
jgi:hypothetical protein